MTIKNRLQMLMLGVCAGATLVPAYASAQDAQSDRLQRQVDMLQRQLQTLQKQVDANKASQSSAAVGGPAEGAYAAAGPKSLLKVKAPPALPIKMTWGGFLAAETVYRQHNTVSDMSTPFTSIPYPFSPQYGEPEFRGSARASRLSLLVEGSVDPVQKLAGYYEMDFLGVGVTSNYNQTNSWAPRVRHAYLTYDNSDWGWHLLAGQSWSLLTQNTVGITPRKENIPLVIDGNIVAGFDYTRNWQIRMVKDFGSTFALGLSAEAAAEQVYSSTGATANGGSLNGLIVNWANPGTSFLGSGAFANNFNTESAPDVIGKAAFDPGWGHYEAFGLVRFFTDNVFTCSVVNANGTCPLTAANVGAQSSKITVGEGVGGSVLLPIVPKFLDVTASALYGKGIGRYRRRPVGRCRRRVQRHPVTDHGFARHGRSSGSPLGRAGYLRLWRVRKSRHQSVQLSRRHHRIWQSDLHQYRLRNRDGRVVQHSRPDQLRGRQQRSGHGDCRLLAERLEGQLRPGGSGHAVRVHRPQVLRHQPGPRRRRLHQ